MHLCDLNFVVLTTSFSIYRWVSLNTMDGSIPFCRQGSKSVWSWASLMQGQAFAQYFMLCSPVLSCVSWCVCRDRDCFRYRELQKHTSPYQEESLTPCVFIGRVSVWQDCFECDWSLVCGCMCLLGEEGDCLCERVRTHTHTHTHLSSPLVKQNLWNAEECHFWTGAWSYYKQVSSALCTPNITHGLHFHIKENTGACTLSLLQTHARTHTHTHI